MVTDILNEPAAFIFMVKTSVTMLATMRRLNPIWTQ
jgi:hypothetical protein